MEQEKREYSEELKLLLPEHKKFFSLTMKKLHEEDDFQFSDEGHTAGNLCQGLLADSCIGLSEDERVDNVKNYLKYIANKKGNNILDFIVTNLDFPLPQGTTIKDYLK